MSVDYAERVEEVELLLASEFAVTDREVVEVLLAARLPCALPVPWIVLETPYYSLTSDMVWFSLIGGKTIPLPLLRLMRPRQSNVEVKELLRDREQALVFIEPFSKAMVKPHYRLVMWDYLMQECVRMRVAHPKRKLPDARSVQLLEAAVGRVMDERWRRSKPQIARVPGALPYYAELLQRLSPYLRSWESLLGNLAAIAARRAYLFDREVGEEDWAVVGRVMRDSVPEWVGEMLTHFDSRGRIASLRGKYEKAMVLEEMKRLAAEGVIYSHRGEWMIRDQKGLGADVLELIKGIEFAVSAA